MLQQHNTDDNIFLGRFNTADTKKPASVRYVVWKEHVIKGGPKNGYPVLFWDNFGNSAPIVTVLSLLQAKIYGA